MIFGGDIEFAGTHLISNDVREVNFLIAAEMAMTPASSNLFSLGDI